MENISTRIERLLLSKNGGNQSELARFCHVSPQAVQKWIAGKSEPRGKNLTLCAEFLGVSPAHLKFGNQKDSASGTVIAIEQKQNNYNVVNKTLDPDFTLVPADQTVAESGKIEYWDVKGSCGGGFLNFEQMPKGHLIKEISFFKKYDLKPENAFAIYADGDSMAEFIIHGDLVIFDRSKTTPKSGEIFAIDHPDGLRIKVLRRSIDGAWTLESKNPDKRKFPDEVVPTNNLDLLRIHGQFVYRQGG